MRREEIDLPPPPGSDRPGDQWMAGPLCDEEPNKARVRTWSGRRRKFALFFVGGFVCFILILVLVVPSAELFKPGELSSPHAQILTGTVSQERCATCHVKASLSPVAWFRSASEGHEGVRQSDLCIRCHHATIAPNLAYSAHNLPRSVRDDLSSTIRLASHDSRDKVGFSLSRRIPNVAIDQNDVACATCHKEHHGSSGDLLAISNQQCQSCHSVRFGAFADSHPDWDQWPYGRGGSIAFDHASHQAKHFPGWKSGAVEFRCVQCHPTTTGESKGGGFAKSDVLRVASYEQACKRCHDEAIDLQLEQGVEFVALPMIEQTLADRAAPWPEESTGFVDGVVPPIQELLLRSDPSIASWLRRVPGGDLSRVSLGSEETDHRLIGLAKSTRQLIAEFAMEGHVSVEKRLVQIGVSAGPIRSVLRSLPPQLFESAHQGWFDEPLDTRKSDPDGMRSARFWSPNNLSTQTSPIRLVVADEDDLLGDEGGGQHDLLSGGLLGSATADANGEDPLLEDMPVGDALLEDPLLEGSGDLLRSGDPLLSSESVEKATTSLSAKFASGRIPFGGWYRDDQRLSVRYRGSGHADPVLVGLIETFSQLGRADPLKERFFAGAAVRECIRCHQGARTFPVSWDSGRKHEAVESFTKFSHRPHLNVSALGDCMHCHQVAEKTDPDSTIDFKPLTRQNCVQCHTANAAGDRCTTCHRYHIHQ